MRKSLLALCAPFVVLLGDACVPAAAPATGAVPLADQVTVRGADDFRFNPSTITVSAGQPLEVTFQNDGEILHDFTVQQGLSQSKMILEDGGRSGTVIVTYDKPGIFKFFCSQPGHEQLGMRGTITVQ